VIELADEELLEQYLDVHRPDILLLDVGITASSATRYRPSDVLSTVNLPVVAIVAAEREQRGIRAVAHGAGHYITIEQCQSPRLSQALSMVREQDAFTRAMGGVQPVMEALLAGMADGALIVSPAGRVLQMNAQARRLLGLSRDFCPDPAWHDEFAAIDIESGAPLPPSDRPLARLARGEVFDGFACLHATAPNEHTVLLTHGRRLEDLHGRVAGYMLSFRDVSERVERERTLTQESLYDALTGVANRRLCERQLAQAVARAERSQRTLGVLFIDLDRFKSVNDSLGHDIGDVLLKAAAERLQTLLRQGDMIARWGGDEFVVVLENLTSPRDAAAVAHKIVRSMSEKFQCGRHEVYISASIGIALYPESGDSGAALITAADQAMYRAKRDGGARLQFFANSPMAPDTSLEELEVGLRHALLRRELVLRYQPRVNLATGRLLGLEVLLRWQHPRYGLLPPSRFVSLLESSGLIHSVGEWVVSTVCKQLQAWQHRYGVPDLTVSMNLSPAQLAQGRLPEVVQQCITDLGLDPGCLEFELADGAECLQRPQELTTIRALRQLGVGISLDHFGIGDVTFAALDPALVSAFVLHQSLIQDIADNETHQAVVRAAVAMAEGLDIQVSAEGVESAEQLQYLRKAQCTSAQGFYIARPMAADKIAGLLHTESLGAPLMDDASAA
ncbi:MAG: EAL domain-containing protein, partial [Pseudomonadota bacterium]